MATYNVSNSSELMSALNGASGGDVIELSGGSYGSITVSKKFTGTVTITSGDGGQAKFTSMDLKNASNVTIDGVAFSGGSQGLKVTGSSNIKVLNSDFSGLNYGASFTNSSGLTVSNNHATSLTYDAFRFAGVTNVNISGNTYQEQGSKPGPNHKDFIQFWTEGTGPSKGISITNNKFYSDDGSTHGIFMNGSNFNGGAFQDVYIANNYFKSSHIHGITVAHGNNVEIRNNTLIQDGKYPPLINVTPESVNVKIIGNTAPSVPPPGNSTWEVSGNHETGGGTHWPGGSAGAAIVSTAVQTGADAAADAAAADHGGDDVFRFSDTKLDAAGTAGASAQDFADSDTLAGRKALDATSDAVSDAADADIDLLIADIDQGAASHRVADTGHDFLSL